MAPFLSFVDLLQDFYWGELISALSPLVTLVYGDYKTLVARNGGSMLVFVSTGIVILSADLSHLYQLKKFKFKNQWGIHRLIIWPHMQLQQLKNVAGEAPQHILLAFIEVPKVPMISIKTNPISLRTTPLSHQPVHFPVDRQNQWLHEICATFHPSDTIRNATLRSCYFFQSSSPISVLPVQDALLWARQENLS